MAVDTKPKRASALTFNSVWTLPSVIPDGSLTQFDRQAGAWAYGGILAIESTAVDPSSRTACCLVSGSQTANVYV